MTAAAWESAEIDPEMGDTAPLTGVTAPPTGAQPRWVHPTGVRGGGLRIAPVAATGLSGPAWGGEAPSAFPTLNRLSIAVLYAV